MKQVQFSSVTQSCPTLCDPMNRSTPGLPVHHQLLEFTQTHVHQISDAIQPSHPLSSPSPPTPNPSQYQGLFQLVNSAHEVAKVLSFSFNISPSKEHPGLISYRMDWLDLPAVQGTQESSSTPQFKSINSSVKSFIYSPTLTSTHDYWKNHSSDYMDLCKAYPRIKSETLRAKSSLQACLFFSWLFPFHRAYIKTSNYLKRLVSRVQFNQISAIHCSMLYNITHA